MTAQTPGQVYEAPPEAETETERLLGWAATLIACGIPGPEMSPAQWFEGARNWQAAVVAAQERPAPGDARELAMLRADLADAEAQLVKWPKCPAGCSCRLGIEDDADRNECGCDGPCNGGPRPAPELAAEVKRLSAENAALRDDAGDNLKLARKVSEQHAELTALRDWLDEATRAMLNLGTRPAEVNLARKIRKEAGFAP